MKNSAAFFANKDCKYYPCHTCEEDINCLFCYCPLYNRSTCPGEYRMITRNGKSIKDCSDCVWPHKAGNYSEMIKLLRQ